MSGLTVVEVLDRAADLIEPEGRWTQGENAKDAFREPTEPEMPDAYCWCLEGALQRCGGKHEAYQAVRLAVGESNLWGWNDAPERTQAEVVAKLREAAAAARNTGAQS